MAYDSRRIAWSTGARSAASHQFVFRSRGCGCFLSGAPPYLRIIVRRRIHLAPFLQWITSYSQDAGFSFSIWKNLVTSIAGHVKLVVGGRLALVRAVWNPFLALTTAGLTALATILAIRLRRARLKLQSGDPGIARMTLTTTMMTIVWIGI